MSTKQTDSVKGNRLYAESGYEDHEREGETQDCIESANGKNIPHKNRFAACILRCLYKQYINVNAAGKYGIGWFIGHISILFPLFLIFYAQTESVSFSIPELNIFIETNWARHLIAAIVVLWLCCSPYRKSCCDGSWFEMFFNFVPIEIVMMLNLAQQNFTVFVTVGLIIIAAELFLLVRIKIKENSSRKSDKVHKFDKVFFRRCTVAITAICLIPGSLYLLSHGMSAPTYQPKQDLLELYSASGGGEANDTVEANSDIYQKNQELWSCFKEKNWKKYSLQEKVAIMQLLADFETRLLRIPSININAGMIGANTLGYYDDETNEIFINTKHLDRSSAEECIGTICHEVRHSMQAQIVKSVDWNNSIFQTPYFDELRSWRENQENYKDYWVDGAQEYEDQPLETDARSYEKNETAKIMSYVRN